jgi:hypothetical protein
MNSTSLRQLIKESIQEYIREVETSGNVAAQEAKIRACDEAITLREKKLNMEGLDEAYHDMIDEAKKKNLEKEIKELQKYKKKAEKILEKMKSKAGKEDEKENVEEEGVIDEVAIDEMDPEAGSQLEEAKKKKKKEEKEPMNESFLYMQKLAGVITEAEYKQKRKLNENDNDYTPPAYEPINDLMDYINQNTGMKGSIRPYHSISWLPSITDTGEDIDMLVYKKGKYEIAIGADDVYQDTDDEDSNVWIIQSNDPNVDFEEHMTFEEAINAASEWLKS